MAAPEIMILSTYPGDLMFIDKLFNVAAGK
jgi:hypothetical protein